MEEEQPISGQRVLHVAPSSHLPAERITDALRQANCEVVSCPDVYRALAWMGGRKRDLPCAIVVCLDLMCADQFEFFQLATRHYRSAPVYVYAHPQAQLKIDLAIRSGARDSIRADGLDRMLPYRPLAGATVPSEATSAAAVSLEPAVVEPVACPPADQPAASAGSDDRIAEQPSKSHEEPAGPARVPWLRYDGGPTRIPPPPTAHTTEIGEPQTGEPPISEPDPPLLSPEELKALIGDETADDSGNGRGRGRGPQ